MSILTAIVGLLHLCFYLSGNLYNASLDIDLLNNMRE